MTLKMLALIAPAIAAAPIALSATAYADDLNFQSPSGNIACTLSPGGATCDIADYTYQVPPGPECSKHIKWGNRFTLSPGKPGAMECHGDTVRVPNEATLNYGQTLTAGTLTCGSDQAGIKCSDSASGHYFWISKDSYKLG
jgi:hypothetical protein